MIKIAQFSEKGFVSVDQIGKNCWINASCPTTAELENLATDLDIPLDFLTDSLDADERSRIETENDAILIVIRVPKVTENGSEVPYSTMPIGIIMKKDYVLTVCALDFTEILDLSNRRLKYFASENRIHFILNIFLKASLLYLKYLKEINKRTAEVEMELQRSMKNEALIKLLNIEKSLVFFTTSLRSNELMMERLVKIRSLDLNADDQDLLEDVIIDNRQAIEMANIYSNILSGMMDAFASVISNNLTIVMKFLTSVTIILMIPTLIASIYGMNVELPFQHSSHAFFITLGISSSLSAVGVLIFLKKKWF